MATEQNAPIRPISSEDLPWGEWSEVPRFTTRYRHLSHTAMGGRYHVGVGIEELPSGKQSAPAHYHLFEEEHVYILEGTLTARIGAASYPMNHGDYVCFPAGQMAGHCLINDGDDPCRYVLVGERKREVVVYTDSNKVLVRPLRQIYDRAATRGYWDGENTGLETGETPSDAAAAVPEPVEGRPPISSHDVEWRDEGVPGSTRFGGRSKHLTEAAVGERYNVGMVIEAPAPGMRLAPRHYHMREEEHAFILEGQVTLLLGDERHVMNPGDYVCFPAGQKLGHSFLNSGGGPCSYLMIGESNRNDVCVYPDSNKVMVKALRSPDCIFDMSARRTYWDGEETHS